MYVRERPYEGIPARLYRSIAEIRRDMEIIEEKIRETEEKLSVHSLISGIMESGNRVIDKSVVLTLEVVRTTLLSITRFFALNACATL